MTTAGDFPILGPASISLPSFRNVLAAAGSPATPEAAGLYNAAIQYGVDPAVLLAVFQHESSFGKAGAAVSTHNVGNLVYTASSAAMGAHKSGRWAAYPTWTASALDTARLLRVYGTNSIRPGKTTSSVRTFPYVWAPSADGNRPSSYGAALARSIAGWTGTTGSPVPKLPAAKVKAKAPLAHAAAPKAAPKAAPITAPAAAPVAAATGSSLGPVVLVVILGLAVVLLFIAI